MADIAFPASRNLKLNIKTAFYSNRFRQLGHSLIASTIDSIPLLSEHRSIVAPLFPSSLALNIGAS